MDIETKEPRNGDAAVAEKEGTRVRDKELKKAPPENSLLTGCSVLVTTSVVWALLSDELLAAPKVPEGILLRAMYPNSPPATDPHLLSGNPGQG